MDETGQDTAGGIFIVTVVIPGNRDEILEYLEKIEVQSGKEKFKWGNVRDESNALIRFADSVCGFVRDVIEGKHRAKDKDEKLTRLYEKAIKEDILIEV